MLLKARGKKYNLLMMRTYPRCESGLGKEVKPVANLPYLVARGLGNVTFGWVTTSLVEVEDVAKE